MNFPSDKRHVGRNHRSVHRNAGNTCDLWELVPWSVKQKKGNIRWERGQTVRRERTVFWLLLLQLFSMQSCASTVWWRSPEAAGSYHNLQGKEAEAYLRVSPKQEIKMTVTHPWKVKKKNTYIKTKLDSLSCILMKDSVWCSLYLGVAVQNTIFIKTEAAERKRTNCHLLAFFFSSK